MEVGEVVSNMRHGVNLAVYSRLSSEIVVCLVKDPTGKLGARVNASRV
jgi:hypothetical protein